MAGAREHRVLLIFRTDESTDGVPVPKSFKVSPDDLLEEFLIIKAADGSTVIERTAGIRRMHLKDKE